jgi:hypothetical protein
MGRGIGSWEGFFGCAQDVSFDLTLRPGLAPQGRFPKGLGDEEGNLACPFQEAPRDPGAILQRSHPTCHLSTSIELEAGRQLSHLTGPAALLPPIDTDE